MVNIIRFCLYVFLVLVQMSCNKDFGNLNDDPNRLKEVAPGTLLAPAQYYGHWTICQRTFRVHNEIMQYTVETGTLNDFARYVFRENEFDYLWVNLYKRANDAHKMYELAERIDDVNNMAAALVMKVYLVSNLTDFFGDIPYTDAFRGEEKLYYPTFDKQSDIYVSLLEDLEKANELFNETASFAANDLIYQNDVAKWKKFTNSLRLRLYMRVSNRPEMKSQEKIYEIFNNGDKYPVFENNGDEAIMRFSGVSPFINGFSNYRTAEFGGNRRMGAFLINLMNTTVDGRRFRFATKNREEKYVGIESGYTESETSDFAFNNGLGTSTYAPALQNANYPLPILTYSEVMFLFAEAALKGYIQEDPELFYNKAIEASWRQWQCTWDNGAGDTYLNRPNVKFDGTLERLMEQKYIAMFFSGFEAWNDYRRTGFPRLTIGPAVANQGILPNRFEYPLIVKATNLENYNKVVSNLGGDNLVTKVWWQTED